MNVVSKTPEKVICHRFSEVFRGGLSNWCAVAHPKKRDFAIVSSWCDSQVILMRSFEGSETGTSGCQ